MTWRTVRQTLSLQSISVIKRCARPRLATALRNRWLTVRVRPSIASVLVTVAHCRLQMKTLALSDHVRLITLRDLRQIRHHRSITTLIPCGGKVNERSFFFLSSTILFISCYHTNNYCLFFYFYSASALLLWLCVGDLVVDDGYWVCTTKPEVIYWLTELIYRIINYIQK